eukprot:342688_1
MNVVNSQIISPTTSNSTTSFYVASDHYNNNGVYFQSGTITCSTPFCHIICDATSSCSSLSVHAESSSTTLVIKCPEQSSCSSAIINVDNINSLSLDCTYGQVSGSSSGACQSLQLHASNVSTASIYCSAYDCNYAKFNISGYNTNIDVHCASESSCQYAQIRAANSNQLKIHCDYSSSCSSAVVYCPYHRAGACNIDCSPWYNSCRDMDIIVESTYTRNYLDIICPPKYFETTTSCDNLQIICSKLDHGTLLIWDLANNKWNCASDTGSSYCCPWSSISTLIPSTISIPPTTVTIPPTTVTIRPTTVSIPTMVTIPIVTSSDSITETNKVGKFEYNENNNNNMSIIIIIIIVFSLLFVIIISVVVFYFQKLINKIQIIQRNPFLMEEIKNKNENHTEIEMQKNLIDGKDDEPVRGQEGKGIQYTRNINADNEDEKEQINDEIVIDNDIDNKVVQEINETVIGN